MRTGLWVVVSWTILLGPLGAQETKAVRASIQNGLQYLEGEGQAWIKGRKCASCHHVPMMIWAMNEASARGLPVNNKVLDEAVSWTMAADNRSKIFPEVKPKDKDKDKEKAKPKDKEKAKVKEKCQAPPESNLALATVYTALSLDAAFKQKKKVAGFERVLDYLVKAQEKDGSWPPLGGRPPIFDNREVTTLLTWLALLPRDQDSKTLSQTRARAQQWWSANHKDDSHQAVVLRLLVAKAAAMPEKVWQAAREELLKRQQPNGGWRQTADRPSDGFATGQSLYALSIAGLDVQAPAMVKGQAFLLKTQELDGAWPMTSRPLKGDKGAKNTGPITYTGTAWATIGLIRTLEAAPPKTGKK